MKGMEGLGRSTCSVGGITPRSSTSSALSRLTSPEAASVWPRLLFTEPMGRGSGRFRARVAAAMAMASIGSPAGVPVPCASK